MQTFQLYNFPARLLSAAVLGLGLPYRNLGPKKICSSKAAILQLGLSYRNLAPCTEPNFRSVRERISANLTGKHFSYITFRRGCFQPYAFCLFSLFSWFKCKHFSYITFRLGGFQLYVFFLLFFHGLNANFSAI